MNGCIFEPKKFLPLEINESDCTCVCWQTNRNDPVVFSERCQTGHQFVEQYFPICSTRSSSLPFPSISTLPLIWAVEWVHCLVQCNLLSLFQNWLSHSQITNLLESSLTCEINYWYCAVVHCNSVAGQCSRRLADFWQIKLECDGCVECRFQEKKNSRHVTLLVIKFYCFSFTVDQIMFKILKGFTCTQHKKRLK